MCFQPTLLEQLHRHFVNLTQQMLQLSRMSAGTKGLLMLFFMLVVGLWQSQGARCVYQGPRGGSTQFIGELVVW
jgi:hypothetical protein